MPTHATTRCLLLLLVSGSAVAGITFDQATTSDICGMCHRDIYRMWRSSAHARSMDNAVFLATYRQAELEDGPGAVRLCLDCHAPMVAVNGDDELVRRVTWEGVNCDTCHSMVSVELLESGPRFELDIGPTKRGPIEGVSELAHKVAFSPLHRSSLACAPCHEFVNSEGTAILSTYSEWLESGAAARGETCQHCHMSLTVGDVVDPRIKSVPQATVNIHKMPGGHSLAQLHKAIGVGVFPTRRGDNLEVQVKLRNKGAGHSVPTGMPGRRIVLRITVTGQQGDKLVEERTYGKVMTDAAGEPISRVVDYFAKGVRAGSDNRLSADESRTETFHFTVPSESNAQVETQLHYEHALGGGDRTWITFFSERRFIRSSDPR